MGKGDSTLVSGGTRLPAILNIAVDDSSWTAITLGANDSCRSILAGLRSGNPWKLSNSSAGSTYKTLSSNIAIDIIKGASETLFYVKTASGNDTLECILLV